MLNDCRKSARDSANPNPEGTDTARNMRFAHMASEIYSRNHERTFRAHNGLFTNVGRMWVFIGSDNVDAEMLEAAKNLKIVVRAGANYDNIDLKATEAEGSVAKNIPGQNSSAIAKLVAGTMLVDARNNFDGTVGFEIAGQAIAVYGFGAVAKICKFSS